MKKNWLLLISATLLCSLLLTACGSKNDAPSDAEPAAHAQVAAPAVPLTPAQEAEASVNAAIDAFKSGRLDGIYDALPASYQADLSKIAQAYAAKIDPALYTQSASLLASLGDLLSAQASNLFSLLNTDPDLDLDDTELPAGLDADDITADQIREFGAWLADFARSLSYDDLAAGNIRPLLSSPRTASLLASGIAEMPSDFASCEISPDTGTPLPDGTVSLRLTSHTDADEEPETEDIHFVKVENKWIPAELAQNWNSTIQEALAGAAEFEIDDETRQLVDTLAPVLQRTVDNLKAAGSPQELKAQATGAFMTIGMMFQE